MYGKNLNFDRVLFTKQMKKTHTILLPNMLPIHFELIKNILNQHGYKCALLKNSSPNIIKFGMENIHNDMCYPCLIVVGQILEAIKSKKYDKNKIAVFMSQTGGGCRASNYIHLLRKALIYAGHPQIPVISFNLSGLEKNPGFKIDISLIKKMASALVYGDMLMLLENQTIPYEIVNGNAKNTTNIWIKKLSDQYEKSTGFGKKIISENLKTMINDFSEIKIKKIPKIKVGIVGEIFVKYSPIANNNLVEFLLKENTEVTVTGVMDFVIFKVDNRIVDIDLFGGSKLKRTLCQKFKKYLEKIQLIFINSLNNSIKFKKPKQFENIKKDVEPYIGYGAKMGEGWLLTAEIIELINNGIKNIVCAQPFGCLPNHIVGKGMIRKILKENPDVNIVCIDYDPGATKINQENRLKLMLATANEQFTKNKN